MMVRGRGKYRYKNEIVEDGKIKGITTEENETSAEFISDDTIEEESIDLPNELPDEIGDTPDTEITDNISEETVIEDSIEEETIEDDIPTVDKVLGDEPVISEEEVAEEEVEEEVSSGASFAEVDNLDNTLSESNLAYLDKQNEVNVSDNAANTDLKQDIKSVLLYMDQLLENLPEDKIVEFAKSDEFVTYKKLFSELGLS